MGSTETLSLGRCTMFRSSLRRRSIPELADFARALEERAPVKQQSTLRQTRMAANEAFFRALNDRLERGTPDAQPLDRPVRVRR